MRTWKRATWAMRCGGDVACTIPAGAVYCELSSSGSGTWRVFRCRVHAEAMGLPYQEPDVRMPQTQQYKSNPQPLKALARTLVFKRKDVRLAQANDL